MSSSLSSSSSPDTSGALSTRQQEPMVEAGLRHPEYPVLEYLPPEAPKYVCSSCGCDLALQDELISKAFSGRDGKAYLFSTTINTIQGKSEDRHLLTGLHTVSDLSCRNCHKTLGWYYVAAHESSQKYKEGKSILEKCSLGKVNGW